MTGYLLVSARALVAAVLLVSAGSRGAAGPRSPGSAPGRAAHRGAGEPGQARRGAARGGRAQSGVLDIAKNAYSIGCMASLYEVEVEPEVRSWLAGLTDHDFGRVDFLVGLLAEHAEHLSEPYARRLGGKVRELRFHLLSRQTRVTYWLAPGRRVILLTVFHKSRGAETAEVARALHMQKVCEAEHGRAHEVFDREVN